jgi:hypothetical protein
MGGLGGAAASAAASRGSGDASPLATGQIAYLGLFPDELTMFRAKRGAFRPKPTNQVIASASMPRPARSAQQAMQAFHKG